MQQVNPELIRVSFSSFDDILSSLNDLETKPKTYKPSPLRTQFSPPTLTPVSSENPNMCNKCGERIFTEKLMTEGKTYHTWCFTCANCTARLTSSFFTRSGINYCKECIEILNPCSTCGKAIAAGTKYAIDGEGKIHHTTCLNRKKVCVKCDKPITEVEVKALGNIFHPDCFRCKECNSLLEGTFINVNGNPVCVACRASTKSKCEACKEPIQKDFTEFKSKIFHTDCFVCTKCNKAIGSSPFYDVGGKPVCQGCDIWK